MILNIVNTQTPALRYERYVTACYLRHVLTEILGFECAVSHNSINDNGYNIVITGNTHEDFRHQSNTILINITNTHTEEIFSSYLQMLKSIPTVDIHEFSRFRYQAYPPPNLPLSDFMLDPHRTFEATKKKRDIVFLGPTNYQQTELLNILAQEGLYIQIVNEELDIKTINNEIASARALILIPQKHLNEVNTCHAFAALCLKTPVITLASRDTWQTSGIISDSILYTPISEGMSSIKILTNQAVLDEQLDSCLSRWTIHSRDADFTSIESFINNFIQSH